MKIDALFLVIILSLTYVSTIEVFSVDSITPKIQAQLTQIKMQLLTSDEPLNINIFIEKLTEMLKSLEASQAKHVSINQKMSEQCRDEEKFRKVEIEDAKFAYIASDNAEKRCEASYNEAKKFLPSLESSLSDYKNQVIIKTSERKVQHQQYLDLKKDWERAISFLRGFSKKIDESAVGKNKASFIQLNEDLIRHVSKIGKLESLIPIFLELEGDENKENSNKMKINKIDAIPKQTNEKKVSPLSFTHNYIKKKSQPEIVNPNNTTAKNDTSVKNSTMEKNAYQVVKVIENKTNEINVTSVKNSTLQKNDTPVKIYTKNKTDKNPTSEKNSTLSINSTQTIPPNAIVAINSTKKLDSLSTETKNASLSNTTYNQINITNPSNEINPVEPDFKLDNLKKIVEKLIVKLVADSYQSDLEESILQANFEKLIAEFNIIIHQIEDSLTKLNKQIQDMNLCMKMEFAIMSEASSKKFRNEKLLSLADRTCVDFVKEFVSATNSRYRQIETMRDILAIIHKRFGEMPVELKKKLMSMNSQFKHYISTTEFKKYEEISRVKIEDNLNGKALSNNTLTK